MLFGINAELLIDHAWGWEPVTMEQIKAYRPQVNSISSGQVLHCPYDAKGARLVVQEMADALALDLVVCNLFLKPLIARPRPCDMNTAMDYLIARPHGWSFPSGHTAASFAAASALWFGGSRLWIPCGILAVLIALSRLYLYVHFPTDVLGGAAVGILCGALGAFAVRRVAVRRDGT